MNDQLEAVRKELFELCDGALAGIIDLDGRLGWIENSLGELQTTLDAILAAMNVEEEGG
jgi:hypothetical protein